MLTAKTFIGSLLDQISLAQAMSDRASVAIADEYLQDDLLKGFPVPRMQINQMDLELNFTVPSRLAGARRLDDVEVQKNITYRLRQMLQELPARPELNGIIDPRSAFTDKWSTGLDELANRLRGIVANTDLGYDEVLSRLGVCIENYVYESVSDDVRASVGAALFVQRDKVSPLTAVLDQGIREVMDLLPSETDEAATSDPLDVCVLVGPADLDKASAGCVNKMTVSISPANRRWVVSQQNGQPVHMLERA